MTVRDQLLHFLREPTEFAAGATDPPVWLDGLAYARATIEDKNDYDLRAAQVAAWEGLSTARTGLVLGPPGTGKTHLLSWLIFAYVHARQKAGLPCRVLITAFTLNAIGNLLEAVAARGREHSSQTLDLRFLGAAPSTGLSSTIQHHPRLDGRGAADAVASVTGASWTVVGASIWSVYRLLDSGAAPGADGLTAELFDLVCIDEASQMVLGHGLLGLGALTETGRVVVAGDDQQLPPVRASREVKLGDRQLGGSLYSFLKSAKVPEFALEETFRLNGPLAAFPERKFYPGKYKSAVHTNQLALKPDWATGLADWERTVLDPQWPICVLLHDGPPSASSNPLEAELSVKLAKLLIDRLPPGEDGGIGPPRDLWSDRLAIVSPHRAQNALIRGMLPEALRRDAFVETVDRIQGKERDAIIISYCVADAEFAIAESAFIFASERLNVAVTRARTKLVVLVSRRLLDAVPADQDIMDKAELLREFVFSCRPAGSIAYPSRDGQNVPVQVRVLGFTEDQILQDVEPDPRAEPVEKPELTPDLLNVLAGTQTAALSNARGDPTLLAIKRVLARGDDVLDDLATLHRLGRVSLRLRKGSYGPFWTARHLDPPRTVIEPDDTTAKARLEELISQVRRGAFPPPYDDVRDRFAWPGAGGRDLLRPAIDKLKDQGLLRLGEFRGSLTVDWIGDEAPAEEGPGPAEPTLSDLDFEVLNDLEHLEARRINFGIFEAWTSAASLADETHRDRQETAAALGRLAAGSWVMLAEEGRVRSRMAELAREVRYVKQRFAREDADERPYLVRSLKLELRERDKPERQIAVGAELERLAVRFGDHPYAAAALRGLSGALDKIWGQDAKLAGFQVRGLEQLTRAWRGDGPDAFVVAADTGSGKTEAAGLPLIVGATADRLAGVGGVRAVLAYPRIRLATNQAQRLAGYLAALAREPGMPTVTLGLQIGQVPETFDRLHQRELDAGWTIAGQDQFSFPFFNCPAPGCDGGLILRHRGGVADADLLTCTHCDWCYDGWVGSKAALRSAPPNFFLPTTDSLHQWLHDSRYGALFGDDPRFAPPRAILADEIHLYSHVHGAQVGLALRRLAARAEANGQDERRVLAIGMSATLGDPARAWGDLIGRENVTLIAPSATEKVRNPRGREYFYFVQPEVESRGQDIAGASTTIQTIMCLAHGMRRRTGRDGGFRSLVFLDSIDKVRRLHAAYTDAEDVKRLPAYRTRLYFDESAGAPRDGCCGEPSGCDSFRDGECWWFAATDGAQRGPRGLRRPGQRLTVADRPVFSGTSGRVEALIKESDVVFSTSSLEVGYDDPDMTLVYQHYAPQNLASFIQRKGRAGRGADDRPITGVTLSIYSSRDSWAFRKPREMIEPTDFSVPLNPDNHFVRRGQLLAATLDGFTRHQNQTGEFVDPMAPSAAAFESAKDLVGRVFGPAAWREFEDCPSLEALWRKAIARASGPFQYVGEARSKIDWIPSVLFETINLPQLMVYVAPGVEPKREDIALALATAAPGNATRRFDQVNVLWRPPTDGYGPWFAPEDYQQGYRPKPYGDDAAQLLGKLPIEARPLLDGLSPELFRPRTLHLQTLGRMHGTGWQSDWVISDDAQPQCRPAANAAQSPRAIRDDSRSTLRGFPIVKANPEKARPLPISRPWLAAADWFAGDSLGGKETGLAMARVYWGVDAEVRLASPREEPAVFSQTFTEPGGERPLLHGYHVQTEGVCFRLNEGRLDEFVTAKLIDLRGDEPSRKWLTGQMLRFLVESGARSAGVNGYEARRGAELMLSAAGDPELRGRLARLLRFWSGEDLARLFEDTRSTLLSQHPLLSQGRVARVAETLSDQRFAAIFSDAVGAAADHDRFRLYLKSLVVHSLAARLRETFLEIGHGDEPKVVTHVELPVQFGETAETTITICEAGAFGDGTTRAFVEHIEKAVAHWDNGFLVHCPNAREDAIVRRLFELSEQHTSWRALDPNDPDALREVHDALCLNDDEAIPASVLRILYGTETVGTHRLAIYDLAASLRRRDGALSTRLGRTPTAWELTSAAVEAAKAEPDSPEGRLLTAFGEIEEASQEESLHAEARLADQIFRIHAHLCVDGCQACVHQPSDMMSDTMVEASTSRRLLREFIEG